MSQVPPELIGIPREVLFRIPIADGKDWLLMLSKKNADFVNARAQAGGITKEQYLVELIKRTLRSGGAPSFGSPEP